MNISPSTSADMSDPLHILRSARRVMFAHAHPDDETLATGALIRELTSLGVQCTVLTATRGEQGEVVPGAIAESDQRTLEEVRAGEISCALHALGVDDHLMLGTPPAWATDHSRPDTAPEQAFHKQRGRRYRDSGMRWIRPGVAGPSASAPADAFTVLPLEQAICDLVAALHDRCPDALVSYDDAGTYGHPDHVRMHQVARAAADRARIPFIEVASEENVVTGLDAAPVAPPQEASFDWYDFPATLDAVAAALSCYRTQLTVRDTFLISPGVVRVQHVGQQVQDVWCRAGLRIAR
ncbi:PIG-L family deacetylase [Devriesea agamarum]|uniref:PIG-L family deacetylase n=1 Tax=Devriesea agamarum TaxID=472569 RepID=UPI00071DEA13|nr:PIG-L family deacetylase [Devriesea agamarum]